MTTNAVAVGFDSRNKAHQSDAGMAIGLRDRAAETSWNFGDGGLSFTGRTNQRMMGLMPPVQPLGEPPNPFGHDVNGPGLARFV